METILFHYAHTMYIKWVRGTAERCEVAQPEWKPWDKTKPWGGGGGESVWNRSIWKEKSHFQKSRARSNPGHFYQFADSCLLRNKLDQTAKEKLVLARILTVCHKKKCTRRVHQLRYRSVYQQKTQNKDILQMSRPCLTHEEIKPDAAGNTEFIEEKAGNTAWIIQFLASVAHFLMP